VMPYLSLNESAAVQVTAAVLRGREPALLLSGEELEVLACLDGQALPERGWSCHAEWSSNGDLKAPRIHAKISVSKLANGQKIGNLPQEPAEAMGSSMEELLHKLQLQGADPLDVGRAVRSLYRGAWTPERWRQAWTRAAVEVQAVYR
jgi:hypothetical protein